MFSGQVSFRLLADGCPPCNQLALLPTTPGGNINVCIDGSWDSSPGSGQTVNDIWNATQGAVNGWNAARGSDGSPLPYAFSLNQQAPCDIKMFSELVPGNEQAPAGITRERTEDGFYKLYLPGMTWNNIASVNDLKGIVGHELGHPLGLVNTKIGTNPSVGILFY